MAGSCAPHAFRYNATLCACDPGYYLAGGACDLFDALGGEWVTSSGVEPTPTFFATVLPIKRLTPSQASILLATLLSWLALCAALRFLRLDGAWLGPRWWLSRLDLCFATRHWLDDQMVVRKRKTEMGGAFSVASWILFIGLLSA